jgi:hypothetical protein
MMPHRIHRLGQRLAGRRSNVAFGSLSACHARLPDRGPASERSWSLSALCGQLWDLSALCMQ